MAVALFMPLQPDWILSMLDIQFDSRCSHLDVDWPSGRLKSCSVIVIDPYLWSWNFMRHPHIAEIAFYKKINGPCIFSLHQKWSAV